MRNKIILTCFLLSTMLFCFAFCACASSQTTPEQNDSTCTIPPAVSEESAPVEDAGTSSVYDPYAIENHYDINAELFEKHDDDSYLVLLYGNMLHDKLTVPMIIVNVDMYTDILAEKENKTEEELRYIYDKAIDDVALDLMPFIEEHYAVKTGRENTGL